MERQSQVKESGPDNHSIEEDVNKPKMRIAKDESL